MSMGLLFGIGPFVVGLFWAIRSGKREYAKKVWQVHGKLEDRRNRKGGPSARSSGKCVIENTKMNWMGHLC